MHSNLRYEAWPSPCRTPVLGLRSGSTEDPHIHGLHPNSPRHTLSSGRPVLTSDHKAALLKIQHLVPLFPLSSARQINCTFPCSLCNTVCCFFVRQTNSLCPFSQFNMVCCFSIRDQFYTPLYSVPYGILLLYMTDQFCVPLLSVQYDMLLLCKMDQFCMPLFSVHYSNVASRKSAENQVDLR